MTSQIAIEEQPGQAALEVAVEVPLWKIPKALGEHFPRILQHIKQQGSERVGAPYASYLDIDWAAVRTEGVLSQIWQLLTRKQKMRIGMAVPSGMAAGDGMEAVTREAGRFVKAIHRGPYHKVGETYKEIANWAVENQVSMANFTTENYINDPTEVAAEDIETLILIPVVD